MAPASASRRRRGSATPPALRNALSRLYGCNSIDDGRVLIGCCYCGAPGEVWWEPPRPREWSSKNRAARTFSTLEVDHLIPWIRGGRHTIDNVDFACQRCNSRKGTMTALEYAACIGAA